MLPWVVAEHFWHLLRQCVFKSDAKNKTKKGLNWGLFQSKIDAIIAERVIAFLGAGAAFLSSFHIHFSSDFSSFSVKEQHWEMAVSGCFFKRVFKLLFCACFFALRCFRVQWQSIFCTIPGRASPSNDPASPESRYFSCAWDTRLFRWSAPANSPTDPCEEMLRRCFAKRDQY